MEIENEYTNSGFRQLEFRFKGKKAIIILPDESNDNGKMVLKTEYFGAFPDLQIQFVRRGYTFIFVENRNRWGTDSEIDDQYEFINYVSKELGKENSVITIGMSCGGLISVKLCAKYPDAVKALYLDAPVMNFLSIPARFGNAYEVTDGMWEEFYDAYHMTKTELLTYREHPIDMVPFLLEHKKRIYLTYGDSDHVVPYEENGLYLEKFYRENGGEIKTEKKVGVGHHPHGPSDPDLVINYFENINE